MGALIFGSRLGFSGFREVIVGTLTSGTNGTGCLVFNDLFGNAKLYGSAAATSMLTIIFVCIILTPVLIRTWRDFNRKGI